ncbi:NucA/NucB deoxyribonuclease domain-containing protein [Streptomyces herbicida]|uniref:NucA/NucB deoxyribonuclease domain-containing protein n=1 Tax=Streptomyces herbicida TaxID=3065675 RepID=UPI002931DEBA|nr:NucA/NucB deoxyribonuclease domain-containing protein [Streptomyces sp. NEAU-HV9]
MRHQVKTSSKLITTAAAMLLAASGTIAASAPYSETSGKNEITVTTGAVKSDFTADTFKTNAATPRAGEPAGYCKYPNPYTTAVNRTMNCYHMPIKVNVKRNGRTVGTASFTVWHEIHLNLKRVKWSEKITVGKATLTGSAGGISTTFHPSCGSGCQVHAGGGLASPFTLNGHVHTGSADHTFTVSAGHPRTSQTRYEFDFTKPGYTSGDFPYVGFKYRCDDEDRQYGAGCVYTGTLSVEKDWTKLSDMANLPGIGDNIRKVQHAGLHIGYPGSTVPLTRATKDQVDANRRAVCGPSVHPKPGDIWWTVDPHDDGTKPSCDEYPFAETTQGGTTYNPPNRSIKWVPLKENRQQGGILRTFFGRYHILPGDKFYVQAGR